MQARSKPFGNATWKARPVGPSRIGSLTAITLAILLVASTPLAAADAQAPNGPVRQELIQDSTRGIECQAQGGCLGGVQDDVRWAEDAATGLVGYGVATVGGLTHLGGGSAGGGNGPTQYCPRSPPFLGQTPQMNLVCLEAVNDAIHKVDEVGRGGCVGACVPDTGPLLDDVVGLAGYGAGTAVGAALWAVDQLPHGGGTGGSPDAYCPRAPPLTQVSMTLVCQDAVADVLEKLGGVGDCGDCGVPDPGPLPDPVDPCQASDWVVISGDPTLNANHNYVIWQNKDSTLFQGNVKFGLSWNNQGDYSYFLQHVHADVYAWYPSGDQGPGAYYATDFDNADGGNLARNPCYGFIWDSGHSNSVSNPPYVVVHERVDMSTVTTGAESGHSTTVGQSTTSTTTDSETIDVSAKDGLSGSVSHSESRSYGQSTSFTTDWGTSVSITATSWSGADGATAIGPIPPING